MVGAPVPNCALDVALRLQLSLQRSARELGHLIVGSETERDQLIGCEVADPTSQIARQQSLETSALLQANDPILRPEWHEPQQSDGEEEGERYDYLPRSHRTRVAGELDRSYDDVNEKDRQREEVVRRDISPVAAVSLSGVRQIQLLSLFGQT